MGNLFQPSLNFWSGSGIDIRAEGLSLPSGALNYSSLLLYVHGYNNDAEEASASYRNFQDLQNKLGGISINIAGILWPGANWTGALFYMKALGQAEKVGKNLARQLHGQARSRGYLKLDIVAHSLGNRLVLEMISELRELIKKEPVPLVLGQLALMAGAVPVRYLQTGKSLNGALNAFSSSLSLYSRSDSVLQFAFPAGQSAAGEDFFPVALGRKRWADAPMAVPALQQIENVDYGHGDYWSGRSAEPDINKHAAKKVRDFMPHIGKLTQRVIVSSATSSRGLLSRDTTSARTVSVRNVFERG